MFLFGDDFDRLFLFRNPDEQVFERVPLRLQFAELPAVLDGQGAQPRRHFCRSVRGNPQPRAVRRSFALDTAAPASIAAPRPTPSILVAARRSHMRGISPRVVAACAGTSMEKLLRLT